MKLRDYQQAAVDAIPAYFSAKKGNPLLVLPTGAGKSVIQAEFIRRTLERWPGQRVIVCTHVKELVEQNSEKLRTLWPEAPMGVVCAGMRQKNFDAQIIYGSVQSMHHRTAAVGHTDLLIVDEAHLVPRRGDAMYGRFIDLLRIINPHMKVIGLTATPYRTDSGLLHRGPDRIFTDVAFDLPVTQLIDRGYLVPVRAKAPQSRADLSAARTRAGEYRSEDAERAMMHGDLTRRAVDEVIRRGEDRRAWLLFATSVLHAEHIQRCLLDRGIEARVVTGQTPKDERERIIDDFRKERLRALVNVGVLTTGFDAPATDLLALLRPTKSPGLHVQMIGRGMRIAPGKEDCLVLDFAGNCARHGPIADVNVSDQDAPTGESSGGGTHTGPKPKECAHCHEVNASTAVICSACEAPFPASHAAVPDEEALVVSAPTRKWMDVTGVDWRAYQARSSKWYLRIDYRCGLTSVSEYLRRSDEAEAELSAKRMTAEHSKGAARWPLQIEVRRNGRYWNVVSKRELVAPQQHPAFSSRSRASARAGR